MMHNSFKKILIGSILAVSIAIGSQVSANYCTQEQIDNLDPACDANC